MVSHKTGAIGQKAVFVDTSGFLAVLSQSDPAHKEAKRQMAAIIESRRRAITTDYVLDETYTLLKARGLRHLSLLLKTSVDASDSLRVEWTQPERFEAVTTFFLQRLDQGFSFTDCVSFLVMREYGLAEALTADHHFRIAGFKALLEA